MAWKLDKFFDNYNEFCETLKKESLEFSQNFKGRMNEISNDEFLNALKIYENLSEKISKILTYAELKFAVDTTTGADLAKAEILANKISENLLFFELEFNELDTQKQNEILENAGNFKYYLELLIKQKSHRLTFLEEKILLKTAPIRANAFSRLFSETLSSLKFKFKGEILNEEQILALLSDKKRKNRKKAAKSLSKVLQKNQQILSYIYNMIKTNLQITCELRKYESGEMIMHENNQISKQSVDSLIKTTERNFNLVEKFYDKKREILGFDKLYDYDRYAPLGDDEKFSFEDAKNIVLAAFGEFSKEFEKIAKKAFDENWIDEKITSNRQSGAFSHSAVSEIHPFVFLNFTGKRRDVFTLAHELGHAIHQYLAYGVGYFGSFTPLTTAESASIFCEMLVFDYFKNRANKAKKQAILANKIEDIFATLYRQINFTTFEREFHAQKGEVSAEKIDEIWMKHSKKMFGKSLKLRNDYKLWWSYIPHFIHSPFYCYSYAYAQLFVLAIFGLYKSKKCENFTQKYIKFLSLGGSKSPKDMIKIFDLDIEDENFWNIGINEISKLVGEFLND